MTATQDNKKLASTLSTKNGYTGRSFDKLSNSQIQELFSGDFSYIEFEKSFIQKKFHSTTFLKSIQKARENFIKQESSLNDNAKIYLKNEENEDLRLQNRFNNFINIHNGNKICLILDVDNTMLFVRFFSDEININDNVTYYINDDITDSNAIVTEIRVTLELEINDNILMDTIGDECLKYDFWCNDAQHVRML